MKNSKKKDYKEIVILAITIIILSLITRNWPAIKQFLLS